MYQALTPKKSLLGDHARNKGPYRFGYSVEYGKTVDDIRAASNIDDAISKTVNEGNETKERELNQKLAQLVLEQRIQIDVMVNYELLNFNYTNGKVEPLPVHEAVAYRSKYAEDNTNVGAYAVCST